MPAQLPESLQNELTTIVRESTDPSTPQRTPGYFVLAVSSDSTDPHDPSRELQPLFWTSAGPRDVRIEARDARGPPALDTRLAIYSCTKLLTSLAVLALLDDPLGQAKGFHSVDQRVDQWIPELGRDQKKVIKEGDERAEPVLEGIKEGHDITVRMLLTHTSGAGYAFDPPLAKWGTAKGEALDNYSVEHSFTRFPLFQQPGTQWHYSWGLDYASLLVQRISGMPLSQYLRQRFFSKLGMHNTAFNSAELWDAEKHATADYPNPTSIADSAVGMRAHTAGKPGEFFVPSDPTLPLRIYQKGDNPVVGGLSDTPNEQAPRFEMGGHGAWSTPADYARLLSWLLRMYKARIAGDASALSAPESCPFLSETAAKLLFLPSTVGDEDGTLYRSLASQAALMSMSPPDAPGLENLAAHTCGAATVAGGAGPLGEPEGTLYWGGLCRQQWTVTPSLDAALILGTFHVPPFMPATEVKVKRAFFSGMQPTA